MAPSRTNRLVGMSLIALALVALGAVVSGYIWKNPTTDEGAAAHIFQLSVVLQLPLALAFLISAERKAPLSRFSPLALQLAILTIAFLALYHLEHA